MKATIVSIAALFAVSSVSASPLKPRCSPSEISGKSQDADCVEAYSGEASASYSLTVPISGGSLQIKCGKKDDRGYFDVYIDGDHFGRGDAYSSSCKSDCPTTEVFTGDLTNVKEGSTITVYNRKSDPRLGDKTPYLDLHQFVFVPSNC
ncbi:MAG: hypothetical protein CYPHOPRED_002423 [Cyphobasidiales sp. Tagirdzhanova-0007]|nr:MAG: hypothetical protein CYPHOPRED_002423 [Cyphobasidiales sp. Tagirdzhanova-0007]